MDPAHLSFTGLEKELGIGLGLGISVGGEEKKLKKKPAHVDINGTVNPRQRTPESDSSYTELSNSTQEGGTTSLLCQGRMKVPPPQSRLRLLGRRLCQGKEAV